jgi:maltose alpha-D-glucosyltransferase / alpha-amylase
VSGFRVDAAPFVMTDNGFARSQPADPHGLLRSLHDLVLTRVPEGLLLGEVNLEADKLAAFFGNGDQLGMLYSFIQKRSVSKCSKPMHRPTT